MCQNKQKYHHNALFFLSVTWGQHTEIQIWIVAYRQLIGFLIPPHWSLVWETGNSKRLWCAERCFSHIHSLCFNTLTWEQNENHNFTHITYTPRSWCEASLKYTTASDWISVEWFLQLLELTVGVNYWCYWRVKLYWFSCELMGCFCCEKMSTVTCWVKSDLISATTDVSLFFSFHLKLVSSSS